jgi:hypothetical protein
MVAVPAESLKFYSFKGLQRKPRKKLAQARRLGPNPPKEGGGDTVGCRLRIHLISMLSLMLRRKIEKTAKTGVTARFSWYAVRNQRLTREYHE